MSNLKPGATLFISKTMHDIRRVRALLREHRYCLEKNVEKQTDHLMRRIAQLESANSALCDDITRIYEQVAALKCEPEAGLQPEEAGVHAHGARLYLISNQDQTAPDK